MSLYLVNLLVVYLDGVLVGRSFCLLVYSPSQGYAAARCFFPSAVKMNFE